MNEGITETLLDAEVPLEEVKHFFKIFGGAKLYIPRQLPPNHRLAQAGPATVQALCDIYGGLSISVPTGVKLRRETKNLRIRQLSRDGMSSNQIAATLHVPVRRVYRVIGQDDSKQAEKMRRGSERRRRNERVSELLRNGVPAAQIARSLGIKPRTVYNLRAKLNPAELPKRQENPDQLQLF